VAGIPNMGDKGPLDALREMWGERDFMRRTHGAPKRTQFIAALWAIHQDGHARDRALGLTKPFCAVPELERYAWWLATMWAGEYGWDTAQLINAVRAASAQTTVTNTQPEARADA
jgi:hypothetical protein